MLSLFLEKQWLFNNSLHTIKYFLIISMNNIV